MYSPKCVANAAAFSIKEAGIDGEGLEYFRDVQWTADGTSLLATTAKNSIQTFIVPPDLLEETAEPHLLTPYCTIVSSEPVNAVAGYPSFSLQDPNTALVLSSSRDLPIHLNSALTGHLGASYPLVNPMTEAYICPNSLLFTPDGNSFIAGSESLLSIFDLSRPGQEPTSSIATGPRRKNDGHYNPVINMRGIVSALAIDPASRVLAAGTYSRHVGLYDSLGDGDCVGVFSVKETTADAEIGGSGVTQLSWSPCGRYLYITERKSDGAMVYDIRKTGQLLSWLKGRNAQTNQRMGLDLAPIRDQSDHEIWAGGLDGCVRTWTSPHHREGSLSPDLEFKAHADVVSTTTVHRNGGVIATTTGQRRFLDDSASCEPSSSLQIWAL